MKSFCTVALSALLASFAMAAPAEEVEARAAGPTLYMAGDSTMATARGASKIQGWGAFLAYSMKDITVVNKALGGRSARSYTVEQRFKTLIDLVVPGDFVIISFGHNDGGRIRDDNGRTACPGADDETCTLADGKTVVQTYVTYLTDAAKALVKKGARVIVSSPTPRNICADGTCNYTPPRWVEYSKKVVANTGSQASFVDHGLFVANEYKRLGKAKVDSLYPTDELHPGPEGSELIAKLFVKAVLCTNNVLLPFVKNATNSVPGSCA
ncbi:rhamnogalacturonan acetylesterase precursor [Diplocarpon rosae]|nr:rhamnogalacturonan acetylesterase precursor [Diplocarpon rosae]